MQPSHAELARTLAAGSLPASAHIACRPGPYPVRHVTDSEGRVLLLAPADGALTIALRPADGNDDTAIVLDICDVPPAFGAPSLGRVWVAGWAVALAGDEAREAAVEYCELDPTEDLLDVGAGQVLHRMQVAEVRLERGGMTFDVDPDEYAAATPDPLRAVEFDLIADLADHHITEVSSYVRRQLGPAADPGDQPRVVRLDRYGFVVDLGTRLARLPFARPVRDRADLAQLLHPVLCQRCAGSVA
jgi:hypothetical protein